MSSNKNGAGPAVVVDGRFEQTGVAMTRRLIVAAVALGLVPLLAPAPRAQQAEGAGHVTYVSVTGRNDVPVTGLVAANFRVREDNQDREILKVAPAPPPSHLALLIDDGQAIHALAMVPDFRKMLPAVFREALKVLPGAQLTYWTLGEPPTRRVPFTTNITSFDAALAVFAGRPGPGASLVEAVYLAAGEMTAANAQRPVIVTFVLEDNAEVAERKGEVAEAGVKQAGASLWTIVLQHQMRSQMGPTPDSPGGDPSRGMTDMSLGELTSLSGGGGLNQLRDRGFVSGDVTKRSGGLERRVGSKQDIGPMFSRVLNMIANRYEVTYARPAGAPVPKRFEVRLQGKSGTVAAPQWAVR
jgi:hypothetical protein